ncbi:GGDEF domain-containing protein [Niallia oryzisoli]|uniref:GGDEF domain-containing protein n=1 Tax=Niallia oryzisoli TaxID=1737571 RepID=A0ABZ2CAV6_9BACI
MSIVIGDIAKECITVDPSTKCQNVYSMFEEKTALEGIVVVSEEKPIGLVMKTHFFQKLSTKYGFDLFMNRHIDLVMGDELLIVDYSIPITEVSSLAMNRKQENLYDLVIVTKQNHMYGAVSIRELIMKLSELQIRIARYSNPLSGLPGNNVIAETLQEVITYKRFSVFYIDIDSFKFFNDTFGFREGDEIIKETAVIISDTIQTTDNEPSFIGHIGGDDFIAVIPHYHYEELCKEIIFRFDRYIMRFYTEEEIERGYVQGINRQGILDNVPLVSISIAVVHNKQYPITSIEQLSREAAKIKKRCKNITKSTFLALTE